MADASTLQDLRRHDLVDADPAAWDEALAHRPDLAGLPEVFGWVRAGRPLILRRFDGAEDRTRVPLGLPLPPALGKRRIGLALPSDAVRPRPPVTLAEAKTTAPIPWRPSLDALLALGRDHGLVPRVFGGLLWQHLTGLAYLTGTSDLDLLWPVGPRVSRVLLRDIAAIEAAAPMRLDGEVIFADGAGVNWREFLGTAPLPPPSAGEGGPRAKS
ncbi:malonate decarboxylase holo-[acyl-carrier-protein] synthase, partial [Methylobacterium trifolii]|uniref:malonate decarboxylase holo-[acyl-carrier-protein] synthase n=1 Tax=Methylobacterium trifolii TaxID=1003092 RepID=UPI001EDFE2CB